MSCSDKKNIVKEIHINDAEGLQGPPGPAGPAGPPGPPPDSFPADDVLLDGLAYANVQELAEALLYEVIVIQSFSAGATQYDLGRQLTALTFNWSLSKGIVSQTLTGPPEMTPVTLTAGQRSVSVSLANLSSNATFTLTVDDGTNTVQSNFSIQFNNRNFFGDAVIPGTINSAFLLSLQSILKSNRSHSYNTEATGSQYNWYCFPTRYGTPTFYYNGFVGSFSKIQTLSFTNAYGYTEDYEIYRSDNPDIGPGIPIQVS